MNRAYVRVSTIEQNEARQVEALQKHDIDVWYTEKVSGKNADRPELQKMLAEAQEGDTIYVHDLSRLARSTLDLLTIVDSLTKRGIHFVSNKENLDTSTPVGKLTLTIFAGIAEFERTNLLERQAEGIAIAKRNGAYKNCGRKAVVIDGIETIIKSIADGTMKKVEAARQLGVSRPTLDRIIRDAEIA